MSRKNIVASHTNMPLYQLYYWMGLSALLPVRIIGGPSWYRIVPRVDLGVDMEQIMEQARRWIGRNPRWDAAAVDQFVARYTLVSEGKEVSFAIDAHDGKEIMAPDLLASCDYYFKANRWRDMSYPDKVLPIVNGNGFLRRRHLDRLKSLRDSGRNTDFLFISRVWGGFEHNVRLFEALASLPFKKRLVAIFVEGVTNGEATDDAFRRLEAVGVECTFSLLSAKSLWQNIAAAKVVMLRAGKYMCIPWRMIDLLCQGACIVSDAEFEPQWPVPLVNGEHYISGGIKRPADTSAADPEEYSQLAETIRALLQDDERMNYMRRNCIEYFERHAAPDQVGRYLLSRLSQGIG